MGHNMIADIQEKYDQLSAKQKEIFAGYGLRQIKHFVEINLPDMEAVMPAGALVQGINADGKVQAYDSATGQHYIWISDKQWQLSTKATEMVDSKEDAMTVWRIFDLQKYELIDLSHVHRDFLESQTA
ncbi:hypothetical protein F7P75_08400 [Acinetobacter gandensis]|nr:hypothetical protein [Acinetobacter gandensis]KAB0626591.1 hypothetical protein F7P75_08400 [Acinetobacter gandensis]